MFLLFIASLAAHKGMTAEVPAFLHALMSGSRNKAKPGVTGQCDVGGTTTTTGETTTTTIGGTTTTTKGGTTTTTTTTTIGGTTTTTKGTTTTTTTVGTASAILARAPS
ncbi:hypothetical protein FHG87_019368 [Trinorchestia longiramus]|nr:hypothetical protein FHG87_019368 [Trinorchestia longiramus]